MQIKSSHPESHENGKERKGIIVCLNDKSSPIHGWVFDILSQKNREVILQSDPKVGNSRGRNILILQDDLD